MLYFLGHFSWPMANLHDGAAYWTCYTNHLGDWTILKFNIIKQMILNVLFIGKLLFLKVHTVTLFYNQGWNNLTMNALTYAVLPWFKSKDKMAQHLLIILSCTMLPWHVNNQARRTQHLIPCSVLLCGTPDKQGRHSLYEVLLPATLLSLFLKMGVWPVPVTITAIYTSCRGSRQEAKSTQHLILKTVWDSSNIQRE